MEVSGQLRALAALPAGKEPPRYPLDRIFIHVHLLSMPNYTENTKILRGAEILAMRTRDLPPKMEFYPLFREGKLVPVLN
jgi:hypothetical protein